ncbi:MAG: phosphoribosylamine--glycine ligase [Candidatus Riflebacteria bacterium]|nr:phosphoribosylamine--glycine ligase [Candidatus Riflebacteria bacterium]
MKIALIGSGGREAAIAWKLRKDALPENVFVLPGNGGIENSIPINPLDFKKVEEFIETQKIGLIIVGPEKPLQFGVVDYLKNSGKLVLGPNKKAALLESSKCYAKSFMKKYGVATADFKEFSSPKEAFDSIDRDNPQVIKFDGLAAGKGVFVCKDFSEATDALHKIEKTYGSDSRIIVEETLSGPELSIIGFTDGKSFSLISPSQDHKRLLNGNKGPNTGGMGAFCPVPFCDKSLVKKIEKEIIFPTLKGIQAEKLDYLGPIYFGVMITPDGPKLLEYNARMGDPETQVLLPSLKTSLIDIAEACFAGKLDEIKIEVVDKYFMGVVLATGGYPEKSSPEAKINGLSEVDKEILLFHMSTKKIENDFYTNGGRILTVVGSGKTLKAASEKTYKACRKISFAGMQYRTDIGKS